jgi:hypothetical protein
MKRLGFLGSALFVAVLSAQTVSGQNAVDVLRYSSDQVLGDAYQLSTGGAFTMFYGSTANAMLNPASAGLATGSGFSYGVGVRNTSDESGVFGTGGLTAMNRQALAISDFSYLYKFPTTQGSLVLGWSINKTNDFNRTSRTSGFNTSSSIVDRFVRDDYYHYSAWSVYAIDSVNGVPRSVWRLGTFSGVQQDYELTESGQSHEMNFFWATEFKPGVFVGASVVFPFGSYQYRMTFIETDINNSYNNLALGNDITDLVLQDDIEARFRSAYVRIGTVLNPVPWLNISGSYRSRATYNISEEYRTRMQSSFDNNDVFDDRFNGEVEYEVIAPARYSAGIGVTFDRFKAGFTSEWADYGDARIAFDASVFDRDLALLERSINADAASSFRGTMRLALAAEYGFTKDVAVRAGYVFQPDQERALKRNAKTASAGVSWKLGKNMSFDAGMRMHLFDDANTVYDEAEGRFLTTSDVVQVHGFGTFRFRFR